MDDERRGGRVLVVDDHPLTREGLSLAARAAMPEISVVAAGSAKEALEAVRRSEWRMILLDLELPDAHGLAAILTLQAHAPGTKIVVVSAIERPSSIEAARALGAAGYLFKSLPLDSLASRLTTIAAPRPSSLPSPSLPPSSSGCNRRVLTLAAAALTTNGSGMIDQRNLEEAFSAAFREAFGGRVVGVAES
jgi:DNA-binding NarL/FixJ family response regulator